jgi:general secretion pathway protein E
VGHILTKLGLVQEKDVASAYANEFGLSTLAPDEFPETVVLESANAKFLRHARALPIAELPDQIVVAMVDPLDGYTVRSLEMLAGKPVVVRVATPSDLDMAHERLYQAAKAPIGEVVGAADGDDGDADEDVARLRDLASEAPVIRLVNQLIARGVESRASDIHVEPFYNRVVLRYRVDGMLVEGSPPPARLRAAVISRIKIMANLDIAERRLPQDGRIRLRVQGKEIDLRVSTVPTMHGESVVMRILDKGGVALDFAKLGFEDDVLKVFLDVLLQPHGVLLVTGPTGSGKTTTLYTALDRLNQPDVKILTVEDPVEYQMPGINQIQVKPQIDLTFANALRSIVRQDPDVIMIGEIRDLETAQIAVQSALTGHLVLSTVHTNDAPSTVNRLLDMGVEDYLLTSTVIGILAQRLVRKLCEHCKEPYVALPELVEQMKLAKYTGDAKITLWHAKGCSHCAQTGYTGRICITEIMPMTDGLRSLVMKHANAAELRAEAIRGGMVSMYEDGLRKAVKGVTTFEEVLRATRED